MKYGRQLEQQSVPEWRLHNLDYNSLKHEIKVHTTRDQATAIAIPGHQDTALRKFEDGLYLELCRQHDRVGLFISSKADEISRRLEHLANNIRRWIAKRPVESETTISTATALKHHRRFARYERELHRCSDDIHALERFAGAQVVAFRKIVKKYKKWTGSTTLSARFSEGVLADPKSFTRRDFSQLQSRHDEILAGLQENTPHINDAASSSDEPLTPETLPPRRSPPRVNFEPLPPSYIDSPIKYWNEYDDGSDAGGPEDEYAIYCDPDEDTSFPGLGYVHAVLSLPFEKAKQWFKVRQSPEREPLLSPDSANSANNAGYASTTTAHTDSDEEGYATSDGIPDYGYSALYAFPSIADQKASRYRERALLWGTLGGFFASFILLGIAGVLITTGRHKLRVEVDAAVTVGAVASLFCACSALGMTMYRQDQLSLSYRLMVWSAFVADCILNGMLLILVVGNAP